MNNKDIEKMMRDAAIEEASKTRERFTGTAEQVYDRLKLGLPDRLRSTEWQRLIGGQMEGLEFNDDVRHAEFVIGVKRGKVVCQVKVSDAGVVDGAPAADVDLELTQVHTSKLLKPSPLAVGSAVGIIKNGVVWGDYLNG